MAIQMNKNESIRNSNTFDVTMIDSNLNPLMTRSTENGE